MNLKEAFRFQNKIQSFMDEVLRVLDRDVNITSTENVYLRHKVMPEAEDETVAVLPDTEYSEHITELVGYLIYLQDEKEKLYMAIREAKNALDIDMDSEVSLNASRQRIAQTLKHMNNLRSQEVIITGGGMGYRFNADGNQVQYRCDVRRVSTINYDRNVIKKELARLNQKADETSARLDLCTVTSEVSYEAPFDVNASFADAFESFAGLERV
ncbi:MAG: hypothetical protein J5528_03380 [Firmicutes bacterium]|nr:hypothetical protein [Bacillota bacterium]